ncbi:MAG: hypothetical protein ABIH66_03455 [bacterium]
MLEIHDTTIFEAPRAVVFATIRDRYEDYLRYVPVVASVKLIEREEIGPGLCRSVTEWEGNANIPGTVKSALKPEMIRWRVHSLWDEEHWSNDWRMETFHFKNIFECYGTIRFEEEENDRTKCTLAAMFHIDVPILGPIAEKYIIKNILNKNLMMNNDAVRRLLEEENSSR